MKSIASALMVVLFAGTGAACVIADSEPTGSSGSGGASSTGSGKTTGGQTTGGQTAGGQTSGGGSGCAAHSDCGADEVCLSGTCNLAWGRAFRFEFVSASVSETDGMGEAWDFPGGLPDPFGQAYLGDGQTLVHTTSVSQDTLSPVWFGEYVDIYLPNSTDELSFFLLDEDASANDLVTGVKGNGAAWLDTVKNAGGFFSWDDGSGNVLNLNVSVL